MSAEADRMTIHAGAPSAPPVNRPTEGGTPANGIVAAESTGHEADGDRGDAAGKPMSVSEATRVVNDVLQELRRELRFSVHEASGRITVQVLRPTTGEVVRQIPMPEVLNMAERLKAGEALKSLGVERWS